MKILSALVLVAGTAGPALCSDYVVTREKHTDAGTMMGQAQPAQDTREVTWIGTDRMRVEEGNKVTIVRADLKKMYMLDVDAKTCSTLDLPLDIKKFVPADMAPMMEQMMSQMKVTVTPTAETKPIGEWNTTRYTLALTMPMGPTSTQEMWVTKDFGIDPSVWHDMYGALLSASPVGPSMAAEMKKVDGIPVLVERTQKVMGSELKSTERVISVEQKEAPADLYEPPKDYTAKPFDPMAEMMKGAPGGRGRKGG